MNWFYTSSTSLYVLTADFQKFLQGFLDIAPVRPARNSPHFATERLCCFNTGCSHELNWLSSVRKPDFRGMKSVGSLSIYSRDGGGPSDSLPCWKILRQTNSTWLHGTPAPRRDSNSSFNLMLPFSSSLSHPSFPFFVSLDNSLRSYP